MKITRFNLINILLTQNSNQVSTLGSLQNVFPKFIEAWIILTLKFNSGISPKSYLGSDKALVKL